MFNLLAGIAFVGAASYLSGGCGPFRVHHAMRAGEKLRVNWSREKFTPRDLAIGMNVEREHRNITGCSPTMSAKIALAHLREKPNYYVLLRRHVDGLGAKPWDAARHRSQRFSPSRKFKGSEFDSWTDEELMEKVINLLMNDDDAAWHEMDRAYSYTKRAEFTPSKCDIARSYMENAARKISTVRRIYNTGRIDRFAVVGPVVDFALIKQRFDEVVKSYEKSCPSYDGPRP